MILLPRFFALFALITAAIPVAGWLILVSADFLSLGDCLDPQAGWMAFALITALSLVLPPALHSWPDLTRTLPDILRETARAMLFSFSLFALFFLLFSRPLLRWLNLPELMMPAAALFLAPLISCPLLYISYKIAVSLLPRSGPATPPPPSIRIFNMLALLLLILLLCHAFLFPGSQSSLITHSGKLAMLCAAWRFFALRHVIGYCGNAGFVPAWGGCCLISILEMLRALPGADPAETAVMAAAFILMTATSVCLLLPSGRRWLC